jgi:hypothetical protein
MRLCALSRWCEGCRNKGKGQLSSALDRISERITLAFQTLSRLEAIRGNRKQTFTLHSIGLWRRGSQSIPIERSRIFDLLRPKPTVWATAVNGIFGILRLSHFFITIRHEPSLDTPQCANCSSRCSCCNDLPQAADRRRQGNPPQSACAHGSLVG